jgi:type IV secretory pathway VirB10-like protein
MDSLMRLLSKAADVARTSLQCAAAAAGAVMGRVRARSSRSAPESPLRTPPPPSPAPSPPRQPRQPRQPRDDRDGAPPPAAPPAPADPAPIEAVPEPTRGQAARIRAEQRAAEQTGDSPGPEIHVSEPWPGYASMNAPEIIDRLGSSDDAVKAIVLLYESSHRARKTVLRAAN